MVSPPRLHARHGQNQSIEVIAHHNLAGQAEGFAHIK